MEDWLSKFWASRDSKEWREAPSLGRRLLRTVSPILISVKLCMHASLLLQLGTTTTPELPDHYVCVDLKPLGTMNLDQAKIRVSLL